MNDPSIIARIIQATSAVMVGLLIIELCFLGVAL